MPRPRKPTALLNFTGAFRKNPQRALGRIHEPKPTGSIGLAPPILNPAQTKIWDELVAECAPGVLTNADRRALLYLVMAMHAQDDLNASSGGGLFDTKLDARISAGLIQLGMTPASRSRVAAMPVTASQDNGKPTFATV